jgi:hypothetical protein
MKRKEDKKIPLALLSKTERKEGRKKLGIRVPNASHDSFSRFRLTKRRM